MKHVIVGRLCEAANFLTPTRRVGLQRQTP